MVCQGVGMVKTHNNDIQLGVFVYALRGCACAPAMLRQLDRQFVAATTDITSRHTTAACTNLPVIARHGYYRPLLFRRLAVP
jgi:hypothetical protein